MDDGWGSQRTGRPLIISSAPPRIMRGAFFSLGKRRKRCSDAPAPLSCHAFGAAKISLRGGWRWGARLPRRALWSGGVPFPPHWDTAPPPALPPPPTPSRPRALARARLRCAEGPLGSSAAPSRARAEARLVSTTSRRPRRDDVARLPLIPSPGRCSSRRRRSRRALPRSTGWREREKTTAREREKSRRAGGMPENSPSTGSALTLRNPQVQQPPSNPR